MSHRGRTANGALSRLGFAEERSAGRVTCIWGLVVRKAARKDVKKARGIPGAS